MKTPKVHREAKRQRTVCGILIINWVWCNEDNEGWSSVTCKRCLQKWVA